MTQLPSTLVHQVLSYVLSYTIELRHDIDAKKIVRDLQDKSSIQSFFRDRDRDRDRDRNRNNIHNQTLLPRVVLQDNKLYMIKGTSRFYCSDVIVANTTWVFADGCWRECYPDDPHDETITYLLSCPDYIRLQYQKNPHPFIVHYLLQQPEKITWHLFCTNPHEDAVAYCIQHTECINWVSFCKNTNEKAIDYMLQQHREHIDWFVLSQNPSIYILKIKETELQEWMIFLNN